MDIKKEIKSTLNQAEVYKAQGLLTEAKNKYMGAANLIKQHQKVISNHKSLLASISKKIDLLNEEIQKIESAPVAMEMSEQVQEIIKQKFAFSTEGEEAGLEGAIALAKFGQYERALEEFKSLLSKDEIRMEAAKNIIRCYTAMDSEKDAIKQYQQWFSGDFFNPEQMEKLRLMLQNILDKKGLDIVLPAPHDEEPDEMVQPEGPENFEMEDKGPDVDLDISSVGITLTEGPNKGRTQEYDVSFQSGSVINLLISEKDKDFLDVMENGAALEQVQFFSPIAMFDGKAVVVSKSRIESGPKQGNYSVDIKVKSI
jgi:tetratricopeptide (TPR) repeat protein